MRLTLPVIALGILASGLAVKPVDAAISSASLSVTATVQASCLVSTTDTVFTTYAAAANTASAVSVDCDNSTPYMVTLNAAMAPVAATIGRQMTCSGFAMLGHGLSSNSRGAANMRQGMSTDSAPGFGSDFNSLLAIHDQIPAAQCVAPSAYPDAMIVVVTY